MKPFKKIKKVENNFLILFQFLFFTKTAGWGDLFSNTVRYGLIQTDFILVIFVSSKAGVSKHFCKGPGSKYFGLRRSHGLCGNYSPLLL